jgi:SAM-dependent methyltransferase
MRRVDEPAFDAYLEAKRALDERSVHGPTWRAYLEFLRLRDPTAFSTRPRSVLELGCGLGAMLDRTLLGLGRDLDLPLPFSLSYLAVDSSAERLEALRSRSGATRTGDPGEPRLELETRAGDALEELHRLAREGRRFDAVVSHAFADLVDIPRLCAAAAAVLVPGGVFYHSLVFDGITAFLPAAFSEQEREEDERYIAIYHRSMRRPWDGTITPGHAGASGRRLLALLSAPPWRLASAGPSDWIVVPRVNSAGSRPIGVPDEEELVVSAMLGFFAQSIPAELAGARLDHASSGDAGPYDGGLYEGDWQAEADREDFETWLHEKRECLARGELGFYAHNLDILAVLRG